MKMGRLHSREQMYNGGNKKFQTLIIRKLLPKVKPKVCHNVVEGEGDGNSPSVPPLTNGGVQALLGEKINQGNLFEQAPAGVGEGASFDKLPSTNSGCTAFPNVVSLSNHTLRIHGFIPF
jgi:hypothetical protein